MKKQRILAAAVSLIMAAAALPADAVLAVESDPADPPVGADVAELPQLGSIRWDTNTYGGGQEILYPDGTLVITNREESKIAATDVGRYQGVIRTVPILDGEFNYVGQDAYGTNYLTLDSQNTLWNWSWDEDAQKSVKDKVHEGVTDFVAAIALLENGDIVRTSVPDQVMLSDVVQIHETAGMVLALQRDGTLWAYDDGSLYGGEMASKEFVKMDDNVTGFIDAYYIKSGAIYQLAFDGPQKVADTVPDVVYTDNNWQKYMLKGNLLSSISGGKVITEDFQSAVLSSNMLIGYVASDGLPYDLNGNALQLPFPVDEIVKMTSTYILTTDGTLWKVNNSAVYTRAAAADPERVMTHVADFAADTYGESCYLVRTDGTVWAYNADSGVFDQAAGKPSVPPSEEPKEPTTAPTVDEDIITGGNGGNSGNAGAGNSANPGTGDSMIAFSVGALAAAAAGALLIFRKKSGK